MKHPQCKMMSCLWPLNVPWMVSADWSRLVITLTENEKVEAAFDASVLPEGSTDEMQVNELPIRRVLAEFSGAQWMRTALPGLVGK